MHKKHAIGAIVIALVLLGGGFFGGVKYAQSKSRGKVAGAQSNQQFAGRGGGGRFNGGAGGQGFTAGEVLSKDDKSIILKMRDGGSKIVFYSTSTAVSKMAPGSLDDVSVGTSVIVMGSSSADGSVTAQNIQIRPMMPPANNSGQ